MRVMIDTGYNIGTLDIINMRLLNSCSSTAGTTKKVYIMYLYFAHKTSVFST